MSNEYEIMLTTIDNPFDPFTEFDKWWEYDRSCGRDTCAYLASQVYTSPSLSEAEEFDAYNDAIDDIVKNNPLHIYMKAMKKKSDLVTTSIKKY